jgi:hypothetical protein
MIDIVLPRCVSLRTPDFFVSGTWFLMIFLLSHKLSRMSRIFIVSILALVSILLLASWPVDARPSTGSIAEIIDKAWREFKNNDEQFSAYVGTIYLSKLLQ